MNSLSDDEDDVDCHNASVDPLISNKPDCSVDDDDNDDDDDDDLDTVSDDDDDDDELEKLNDDDDDAQDDDDDNNNNNITQKSIISLRIKCSSYKDVTIRIRPNDTIARVKEKILYRLQKDNPNSSFSGNHNNKDFYIRLIAKGRLLAPDSTKMHEFIKSTTGTINNNNNTRLVLRNDDVIHAVLAPRQGPGQPEGPQATLQRSSHATAYSATSSSTTAAATLRGAGINASGLAVPSRPGEFDDDDDESTVNDEDEEEIIEEDDDDDADVDLERGQGTSTTTTNRRTTTSTISNRRRGFDRLRNAGLRRSEVSAVRAYFSRHVDRFIRNHTDFANAIERSISDSDPDALRRRRWLQEEAWMLAQGPTSEFRINLSSVNVFTELHQNPWINTSMTMPGINAPSSAAGSGSAPATGPSTLQARNSNNAAALQQFRQRANTATTSSEAIWRTGGISAQVGTDKDFMWGFCLGFFVGFFMLVWVWMPTVPHKQKLGILTGISFQLALNMLKGSTTNSIHGDADYDLYAEDGGGGGDHAHHLRGSGGGSVDQDVLFDG